MSEIPERPESTIHYLDNVGKVGLAIDKETHDVLILLQTPIGTISESLTKEKALRLGVELVRVSGQTFRFTKPPVVKPPIKEDGDEKSDPDSGDPVAHDEHGAGPGDEDVEPF